MFKPTEEQINAFEQITTLALTQSQRLLVDPEARQRDFEATEEFRKQHTEFYNWLMQTSKGFEFLVNTRHRVQAELGSSNE